MAFWKLASMVFFSAVPWVMVSAEAMAIKASARESVSLESCKVVLDAGRKASRDELWLLVLDCSEGGLNSGMRFWMAAMIALESEWRELRSGLRIGSSLVDCLLQVAHSSGDWESCEKTTVEVVHGRGQRFDIGVDGWDVAEDGASRRCNKEKDVLDGNHVG